MYTLLSVTALLAALTSQTFAQDPYGSGSGSDDPYADGTPTSDAGGNVISDAPGLAELLSVVAPGVTSINSAQAIAIEMDIETFASTWTVAHPAPSILNESPIEHLEGSQLSEDTISSVEDIIESSVTLGPQDMSSLSSLLSPDPSASSWVLEYVSAGNDYQSAALSAIAPIVSSDLNNPDVTSWLGATTPLSVSASLTTDQSSRPTTMKTTATGSSSGSSPDAASSSATLAGSASSSAEASSSSSGSAPTAVSSGLAAAPTAGSQLVLSAVAAAAGIVGMAML